MIMSFSVESFVIWQDIFIIHLDCNIQILDYQQVPVLRTGYTENLKLVELRLYKNNFIHI